jgi:glycosyltransferase involved in cell wall biosynthesis
VALDVGKPSGLGPRVMVVGQGPPTAGGIPTFVTLLLDDQWLRERVRLEYMNTTLRSEKRPGALTPANFFGALSHAAEIFRRGRRMDVVHLNLAAAPTVPLVRALGLSAAAKAAGARVILHAHTGALERCVNRPVYRLLLRLTTMVADEFVVVSSTAERAVGRRGIRATRVTNGVDPGQFRTGPKRGDVTTLTFVGTVCERKGMIDLRDALVSLRANGAPPVRVVVAGDGVQEGPGAFERVVVAYREAGLQEVSFVGRLDRAGIADLLAESDIFCLPSHWEGAPLSLLEAMASEAAPIASSVGDIPEILDGGAAGLLVPPHDPAALAGAIERLARDPEERSRLARAARRRVEDRFTTERTVERLYGMYVSGRPRRPRRSVRHST